MYGINEPYDGDGWGPDLPIRDVEAEGARMKRERKEDEELVPCMLCGKVSAYGLIRNTGCCPTCAASFY